MRAVFGTDRMSLFAAEMLGASDQASQMGGEAASTYSLILAHLIAAEALERLGADGIARPVVGPRGVIELSVARRGNNLFIVFLPQDLSAIRVEVRLGIRGNDPDRLWIEETLGGEKLEEMKSIALGDGELPDDPVLHRLLQAVRETGSE